MSLAVGHMISNKLVLILRLFCSVPIVPSVMSNNSSLRRRLGFYDDSDSELDEASVLLTSRKQVTASADDDFDF